MAAKQNRKPTTQSETQHALEVLARIREGSRRGAETTRRLIAFAKENMPKAS